MPQQVSQTVENNFTGGLKTEFTGLNFPENAATDVDNCIFSIHGEVTRRPGIDFEQNYTSYGIDNINRAINSYKWNNVGGDGETKILVIQSGHELHFYRSTDATEVHPLSTTHLASTVDVRSFSSSSSSVIEPLECQFTDGNGYLFVFHPSLNPFYCTYNAGTITAQAINVQIRDFIGFPELGVDINLRPATLSNEHKYNLINQGWSTAATWVGYSTTPVAIGTGSKVFTIAAGLPITTGQGVKIYSSSASPTPIVPSGLYMSGTVTSYSGTTLTINVFTSTSTGIVSDWIIAPIMAAYIDDWFGALANYPSNADVWWRFKDSTDEFNPLDTQANVTLNTGPAPKGHYIINAFDQQRDAVSGITGLTDVTTIARPKTGAWFQGRIWYSGLDSSQQATGDQSYYTWTENIYFSQVVTGVSQFGYCYQNNDPTSEDLFDALPTDGGVIVIQGSGSIYKLFPVQNGMLVFAANGIWFITGSQGIGFSANDYTITKISSIQAVSACSFIDVLGFPMFWNEEGIYTVNPSDKGGGLVVNNLCYGTILSFYSDIPSVSKRFARGDYNPISFVVSWVYRDTPETTITSRYQFDRVLNFNTANQSFYPYTVGSVSNTHIHDIKYINNPGGDALSSPALCKYVTSFQIPAGIRFTFSEERDETHWVDFYSMNNVGVDYTSFFVTGYKLHGQGITKFQPVYLQMFSKGEIASGYKIQGIWDYSVSGDSGKYSSLQTITHGLVAQFGVVYKRIKIRGRGIALQFKVKSISGTPFSIIGWSSLEAKNVGM